MANTGKYLDYEGLKTYHNTLVSKLQDLEYDPSTLFASKVALLTLDNWRHEDSTVFGIKRGLIVTVGDEIWQLVDTTKFRSKLLESDKTPQQKSDLYTIDDIGWRVLGNTVDFNIDDHVLRLSK